jgi:hypothetical protein
MGIDIHGLNFLRFAKKKKPFGDTLTIGRQAIYVLEPIVRELIGTAGAYTEHAYCEALLTEHFGATGVESIDKSAYEQATHVHDLNAPLPESLYQRYDTVIDMGTLEHIYNAPQALKSCSQCCKRGGQILHVLPANNFCGHGFWQFSPELFFSLYCERNGYSDTEVFIADLADSAKWYLVKQPAPGERVTVSSSTALYVLVRTVLSNTGFSQSDVQQIYYVHAWEKGRMRQPQTAVAPTRFKQRLKQTPFVYKPLVAACNAYLSVKTRMETGLNRRNPRLTAVDVRSCT